MNWLVWITGLAAVLAMAAALGRVFMREGMAGKERRASVTGNLKKRRLSPSRWML